MKRRNSNNFERLRKPCFQRKKAQIQMTESIAVLVVFFIIVVMGFVFYFRVTQTTSVVKETESLELESVQVSQKISFLPEIECSDDNVRRENCIDLLKLDKASAIMIENSLDYYDAFQFAEVRIKQVFPQNDRNGDGNINKDDDWILYSNVPPDWTDKLSTIIPTALRNVTHRETYFGLVIVDIYDR